MVNKNLEVYSWVSIPNMSTKGLQLVLDNLPISRMATGGVKAQNQSVEANVFHKKTRSKAGLYCMKWALLICSPYSRYSHENRKESLRLRLCPLAI